MADLRHAVGASRAWLWGACVLVSALAAAAVLLDVGWAVRTVLVGAFMVLAPALVVICLARFHDALVSVVVAIVVGPSIWAVLASAQALTGWWYPRSTVLVACAVFGAIGAVGLAAQRRRRS